MDAAGKVFLNDQAVTADELAAAPGRRPPRASRDTEVQLRADQTVPYGKVVELMGIAQQGGAEPHRLRDPGAGPSEALSFRHPR